MRAIQVRKPGESLELVEIPVPEPGPGEVRVRVRACGICHSDMFTVAGAWPGISYPRTPGHEIAGNIDAVGAGVTSVWSRESASASAGTAATTERVHFCRRGDFVTCRTLRIPGIAYDGGYAEYVVAPAERAGADPRGASVRRSRAAHVRRGHDL